MNLKISYLSIVISGLLLSGCGGNGGEGGNDDGKPTPPPETVLPSNPKPVIPNTPTNTAGTHPIADEPLSALSLDNVITPIPYNLVSNGVYDVDYEFKQYANNDDTIELLSKNFFNKDEENVQLKNIIWSEGTSLKSVYAYNQKALTSEHGEGIIKAVEPSLGKMAPFFYTDATEALNQMIDVQPAFNCLIAMDYSNKMNYGGNLNVISENMYNEIEALLVLQDIDPDGLEYLQYPINSAINQAVRKIVNNDINEKIRMIDNAYNYFKSNTSIIANNYNDPFLKYSCYDPFATDKFLKSLVAVKESKNSIGNKIEVKYDNADGLNNANILNIELYNFSGSNDNDKDFNKLTHDIVDNIMYKHLFLNKIFGYNGDEDSYISINSFKSGEFVGLYEGLALYHADQYFNSKANYTCNAASLNGCLYNGTGENYGSYGLMISYLLSGYDDTERDEKKLALSNFIDNLKNNAANGCGVDWSAVNYNQVEMSNICIKDAFDNAGFTKPLGTPLTWDDLKTEWTDLMDEYKNDSTYVSDKFQNSKL